MLTTTAPLSSRAGHCLARSSLATARFALTKVQSVLGTLSVLPCPSVLLLLGVIMTLKNLLLEPARTLVKYCQELLSKPLYLLNVTGGVHIRIPGLTLQTIIF